MAHFGQGGDGFLPRSPDPLNFYQGGISAGDGYYQQAGGPMPAGPVGGEGYGGGSFGMSGGGRTGWLEAFSTGSDDPPLFEELGINFAHIRQKTMTVLNPFRTVDSHIMDDSDLAGPILNCLAMATFLLLAGKSHFGYIYGVACFGCVALHFILSLMASDSMGFSRTASVLGYCLLPLCVPAFFGIFLQMDNFAGYAMSAMTIGWCTFAASSMFVAALNMSEARALVMYPVMLFYSVFAVLTVFADKK